MSTDTYEGWANRETWAANLWLANDEGLYLGTLEDARDMWGEAETDDLEVLNREQTARYRLAQCLQARFDEWASDIIEHPEETTSELRSMILDIGSLYRVDWYEVAGHWLIDASEGEGMEGFNVEKMAAR